MFMSYEGEGPNLGLKTLFMKYPDEKDMLYSDLDAINPAAIYVMGQHLQTNETWSKFRAWVEHRKLERFLLTVEFPLLGHRPDHHAALPGLRFGVASYYLADVPVDDRLFIKVRVISNNSSEYVRMRSIANRFADDGHQVLLMPEYQDSGEAFGRKMMADISNIHPRVRLMPPVHHLLGIE